MADSSIQERGVLAVNLDGTLISSNMRFEAFWAAFAERWTTPFLAIHRLFLQRTMLEDKRGAIDVARLPYNEKVVSYIRRWRSEGGRTVLVTESNQALAEKIAAHLGIFDEVYGSDDTSNMKGAAKAIFLQERFGDRGFAYIGHAEVDFPVWKEASKAIVVNPSTAMKARVEVLGPGVEYLAVQPFSAITYLAALRPHQWIKNLLVFLPMLLSHQFTVETFGRSLLAFISFCLIASSAYVLNDLLDLAPDRAHPRKRSRPFASGSVPISHGTWFVPLLLLCGLLVAIPLAQNFVLLILAYYAVTLVYSLYLKRWIVIDICTLASLYTMRIFIGGVATGIPLSVWLLAFAIFIFFSLAAVKRQAELVDGVVSGGTTAHGRGYQLEDLPVVTNMAIASGYISVLVMALYVNSPEVRASYTHPYALWGICLVLLYWISRIVLVTHRGMMHDDPVVYAAKDKISQICFLLIVAFAVGGTLP